MEMNRKGVFISALMLLTLVPAWGKPRTRAEIMKAASETLIKSHPGSMRSPMKDRSLEILQTTDAYTVVGFPETSHAIIANDDLLPAVLAYSATPFDENSDNPGFRWWSRSISKVAESIIKNGKRQAPTPPDQSRYPREIPQLLSDVWGQMEPFNNLCPIEYSASGKPVGRCVVGCVATSATQVMRYHKYPPKGEGVHIDMQTSDANGRPIPLKVDFKDYTFDYANMIDSYSVGNYTQEQADAVARLSYPVGVSFGMIYGTGASGTFSDSAVYSLRKYLKFKDATLHVRRDYSEEKWMNMIYEELSHNRPVLYSGADKWGTIGGGGHAFVLDGYNVDGLVHVNWGWYGKDNGYYEVALLNPRIHSFVDSQDMITGVCAPDASAGENIVSRLTGNITLAQISDAVALSKEGKLHELDLSEAVLPGDNLPDKAFYGSSLRKIILPKSLKSIGNGCFGSCRYLLEVVFPENLSSADFMVENDIVYTRDGKEVIAVLPYYHNEETVLSSFYSLLKFRDGVKKIRPFAADGCFRIQGVLIPESVKQIGSFAFTGCTGLKSVKVEGAVPASVSARAFASLDPGFTCLYLPAASAEAYIRSGEWNKFFAYDNVFEYGTNVVARSYVRNVGEPNPVFGYQIFGDYVTGEPELSCEADVSTPVGEYPIHISKGSLSGEDIVLTDGVLKILKDGTSSVDDVTASGNSFDVYSIDGRIVVRNATSTEGLDKGIYIIEGQKIIIN